MVGAGGATLKMPPSRRTRFRLLADLPLEVAFKSVADRLAIVQVPVSGMWQLRASWSRGLLAVRVSQRREGVAEGDLRGGVGVGAGDGGADDF